MPRFKIGEQVYNTAALDELSLLDIVMFDSQAIGMGADFRWADLEQAALELDGLSEREAERHPRKLLVIAVTIWAARRIAGEAISFEQAIDFPANQLQMLPEPGDRKPGKPKGAKKPRKTTTSASSPASDLEPVVDVSETPTT